MQKVFFYCFGKWWRPILFWGLAALLLMASEFVKSNTYDTLSHILFILAMVGLMVSTIFHLFQRHWGWGIFMGFIFLGSVATYSIYLFTLFLTGNDNFANNLRIPKNIEMNYPKGEVYSDDIRPHSVLNIKRRAPDFELYHSFQPGLYEFDLWTSKIDSGSIYLKAFEITKGTPLSTERLPQRSTVRVYNPTDSVMRFGTTNRFTIYEGDWGKPYAARFEVWYIPANGGPESKLIEKNYVIEGWQR